MNGYIYLIRNLLNGKGYVGKTTLTPERRWLAHQRAAKSGSKSALYDAIRLYGIENFSIVELLNCAECFLDEMEKYFIRTCKTFAASGYGYNLTEGGDGGAKKRPPLTEDHKRKISENCKGIKHPPRSAEWLKRQRSAKLGKKHSEESKLKVSKALKNRPKPPRTEEHKKNMSLAKKGQNKGVPWSQARRAAYEARKK